MWIAWQFNRPDLGKGLVQAFRRPTTSVAGLGLRLNGLEPSAIYQVTRIEQGTTVNLTGQQLMTDGIAVSIAFAPEAATLYYRRVP